MPLSPESNHRGFTPEWQKQGRNPFRPADATPRHNAGNGCTKPEDNSFEQERTQRSEKFLKNLRPLSPLQEALRREALEGLTNSNKAGVLKNIPQGKTGT